MGIFEDWRKGMPYEEIHRKWGPFASCECDDCEKARAKEKEDEASNGCY